MQNKRVMTVMLEWDYGSQARGDSCMKLWFHDNLKKKVNQVDAFFYDNYIDGNLDVLQKDIISFADKVDPDLIFFALYGDQFTEDTLSHLKKKYETVVWFGDDQWRFESFSKKYAPCFTHVITTDPWAMPKYESMDIQPILSEWAGQLFSEPLNQNNFKYDVSFVGGNNPVRSWFIDQLRKKGIKVECFGSGWSNGRTSFQEMEQIFRDSKINLNLSNSASYDFRYMLSSPRNLITALRTPKTVEQIKARNFEIPLAGGFQMTNFIPGLERHFEIGKEIVAYTNIYDCEQLIKYYLKNDKERNLIAKNGYQRANNNHTYQHRIDEILQAIWS